MPKSEFQVKTVLLFLALGLPVTAHAKGQLPMPLVINEYQSSRPGIAALATLHNDYEGQGIPKSIQAHATIWYYRCSISDDLRQMEFSHSYVRRLRVCEAEILRTTGKDGYTSNTSEPLPVPATRLNCIVRYEDCAGEIAIVEATISKDPELAALRRAINVRIGDMKRQHGISSGAVKALEEDEAKYRRTLNRDLFILRDGTPLTQQDLLDLQDRLSRRLSALERMSLTADQFIGLWSNGAGELEIRLLPDGRYYVSAYPVDIDFLKWTCELSGRGRIVNGVLVTNLGSGERLELSLLNGTLHSEHEQRHTGYSEYCGAGGHVGGTWFSTLQ